MSRAIRYDGGTLVLEKFPPDEVPAAFHHDPRIGLPRAAAIHYHAIILDLHRRGISYDDQARDYVSLDRPHHTDRVPRDYQRDAVAAWWQGGRRGVVVLPTGSGKSFVAELCIARGNRSTLVVAPTLDLVSQWHAQLSRAFDCEVGVLGGGLHQVLPLTVATYDSAYLHMDKYGARFGMVVFDEVHHLPGRAFSQAATCAIAPFRLGLTATLERPDGEHQLIDELVGPVAYEQGITALAGNFLADYRTEVLRVHLSQADRAAYDEARGTYRAFVESQGIRVGSAGGWRRFLMAAARSREGRRAHQAWQRSRRILQGAPAKLRLLAELLHRHADGRVLIFTNDNATVYEISQRLLLPALTHHTEIKERRALLAAFASGELPVLVTSRVLNEGVDIPAADVGIVLSGSRTVREHVQRLGRILRPVEGKAAVLYELVIADSVEEQVSDARRDHDAYR